MNISGEDIFFSIFCIFCIISAIASFKWLECVYKFCFNEKYRQAIQEDIDAKVWHEFMCIFAVIPILVEVASIFIIVSIFIETI